MLSLKNQPLKKAVAYYRHSAEDKQENSVPIQREHAQKFAAQHNIEIIHEESDEGVSGLIANRPGFKRLFNDWVQNQSAQQFDYVLFYDISRWGRFQDQNEGAHYAFICKKFGKTLVNVSRGFPQQGQQLTSSLLDSIDRFMAAEYSRVLSDKVWYGCIKVSKEGYSAGGTPCYGMARFLLDENKKPIGMLKKGQHKMISNQRVTFTPLGDETTKAVEQMFNLFKSGKSLNEVAEIINEQGIPSAKGCLWDRDKVLKILTNEAYVGTRVYNKTWGRLKQTKRTNPRSEWIIAEDAFEGIVSKEIFYQVQERLYWSLPSKYRRGKYLIRRVMRQVQKEIRDIFSTQNKSEDEVEALVRNFPVALCISFYKDSSPHWCFTIPEQMRNYNKVLGISIRMDRKDPFHKFFAIPVDAFNTTNLLVFAGSDPCRAEYEIDRNQIDTKILSFV